MHTSLRRIGCTLLVVALLFPLTTPALAAPTAERFSESGLPGSHLVSALWGWLTATLGFTPVESLWAPGGPLIDPNGEPQAAPGPDPAPGDPTSPESTGPSGPGV
jgi:hypothetical protein